MYMFVNAICKCYLFLVRGQSSKDTRKYNGKSQDKKNEFFKCLGIIFIISPILLTVGRLFLNLFFEDFKVLKYIQERLFLLTSIHN